MFQFQSFNSHALHFRQKAIYININISYIIAVLPVLYYHNAIAILMIDPNAVLTHIILSNFNPLLPETFMPSNFEM